MHYSIDNLINIKGHMTCTTKCWIFDPRPNWIAQWVSIQEIQWYFFVKKTIIVINKQRGELKVDKCVAINIIMWQQEKAMDKLE